MSSLCPCGSNVDFAECCEPILQETRPAPTAEALMRSRYTAYVKNDIEYLGKTLTSAQQDDFSPKETKKWAEESTWLGLEIQKTENGTEEDDQGSVEFVAHFSADGKKHLHHEIALFERENGLWRYSGMKEPEGQTVRRDGPKIGRNDPCPCGSGKKYKRCCAK